MNNAVALAKTITTVKKRLKRAEGGPTVVDAKVKAPGIDVTKEKLPGFDVHTGTGISVHSGPIHTGVAGRTDHLPMHVESGSYVIPADIISAMGEGNTIAGYKQMKRIFGGTPYNKAKTAYSAGAAPYGKNPAGQPYDGEGGPYGGEPPEKARGGSASTVPIVAAGGEYVLTPAQVRMIGEGDLDTGHRVLDAFVKKYRAKTIKTLKGLAPPRRD